MSSEGSNYPEVVSQKPDVDLGGGESAVNPEITNCPVPSDHENNEPTEPSNAPVLESAKTEENDALNDATHGASEPSIEETCSGQASPMNVEPPKEPSQEPLEQSDEKINEFLKGSAPQESLQTFLDDEIEIDDSDLEENTSSLKNTNTKPESSSSMPLDPPKTYEVIHDSTGANEPSGDKEVESGADPESSSDSGSESDSEPSSSSDSSDSEDEDQDEGLGTNKTDILEEEEDVIDGPIVSKNEVTEEAPTLPKDYKIPENAPLEYVGDIIGLVEQSAIIKANTSGEFRVLKENSVLCFEDRLVLGPLFEVFGRLQTPNYRVKYNTDEEFQKFKDKKGCKVYYVVPESQFVYTDSIKKFKGTDASNCHDEELPEEEQDFSDDEQELAAKQAKLRKKKQNKLEKVEKNDSGHKNGPPTKKHAPDASQSTFTTYGFNSRASPVPSSSTTQSIPVPRNPPPVVPGQQGSLNYNSNISASQTKSQNTTYDSHNAYPPNPYGVPYSQVQQNYNQNYGQNYGENHTVPFPQPNMHIQPNQWVPNQHHQQATGMEPQYQGFVAGMQQFSQQHQQPQQFYANQYYNPNAPPQNPQYFQQQFQFGQNQGQFGPIYPQPNAGPQNPPVPQQFYPHPHSDQPPQLQQQQQSHVQPQGPQQDNSAALRQLQQLVANKLGEHKKKE